MCYQTFDLFYKALRVDIEIEDPEAYTVQCTVICTVSNDQLKSSNYSTFTPSLVPLHRAAHHTASGS